MPVTTQTLATFSWAAESPVGEYQASPFSPDVHNSHIAKLVEQCQPRKRPGTRKEESLESTYQDAHQQHSSLPCINRNPSTPSFNSKHSVPRTSPPQIFLGDMANPAGRSSSSHMATSSCSGCCSFSESDSGRHLLSSFAALAKSLAGRLGRWRMCHWRHRKGAGEAMEKEGSILLTPVGEARLAGDAGSSLATFFFT